MVLVGGYDPTAMISLAVSVSLLVVLAFVVVTCAAMWLKRERNTEKITGVDIELTIPGYKDNFWAEFQTLTTIVYHKISLNFLEHACIRRRLPTRWLALESLTKQEYTTKSDVWSFGILLWEIVTLGKPYPAISAKSLARKLQEDYRMEKPSNCNDEL
ncbi:tyrosine-protein kinase receptor torso-like [Strongylocentrotus purpuratus]|uniref:Tyrosine-protein kinase catalytic domain-containing protein n=1 Tax=Strongylocentrotus purpuratus TaxID=7668 RepID=A0A7M7NGC6_STRPU|nr:tyrosine-protein kinase receptor torso-like [Strongylocentrotus purpuratus]